MSLFDIMFYVCVACLFALLCWILILVIVTSLQGFWVDKDSLIRSLENQGYSKIKILRHSWFLIAFRGGGKDAIAKFVISAKNPQGKYKTFDVWAKPDTN